MAVRWYLRYALSYRDVEELLAERGVNALTCMMSAVGFVRARRASVFTATGIEPEMARKRQRVFSSQWSRARSFLPAA